VSAPIEFNISILGGATETLRGISGGFEKTEEGAKKAKHGVELFDGEIGKLQGSVGGLTVNLQALGEKGGSIFTFDLAEAVGGTIEAVTSLIEKVVDLGKEILHVVADTQDLNLAINLKVGEEGGKQIEQLAAQFSGTRFSSETIKRAVLPLLDIGLNNDKGLLGDLTTIAADLETRSAGRMKLAETLEAFQHLALRGQISPKMLTGIGIGAKEYFSALAGALHTDIDSATALAKKGKVDTELALQTLVSVVGKREGGEIGSAALAGGRTLGGMIARLEQLPTELFAKLADSPSMEKIGSFIDNLISAIGDEAPEIIATLDTLFGTLFGDLSGPDGALKLKDAIHGVVDAVKGFVADFKEAWPGIKAGMADIWEVAKGIAGALGTAAHWYAEMAGKHSGEGTSRLGDLIFNTEKAFRDVSQGVSHYGAVTPEMTAGLHLNQTAHDFIWRPGGGVQIDPGDTVLGINESAMRGGGDAGPLAGAPSMGDVANHFHFPNAREPQEAAEAVRVELEKFYRRIGLALGVNL
jgi:hypothetical protein